MSLRKVLASAAILLVSTSSAQETHLPFSLTDEQIAAANLTKTATNSINLAVRFERSNWATGSVLEVPFYSSLPRNATNVPAGSVIKVEPFTDIRTFGYNISPSLTLSRIIYQSKTLNGTLVPVSAYVLWPYQPKDGADVAPLVSWGHGASGANPECAPSHTRNLFYLDTPEALALAGYAVVATDYAGIGVPFRPDGQRIPVEFLAGPAGGNDLLYAAKAVAAAFPDTVTREFVTMGHSQGGNAAWAAAQQQVDKEVSGYLGSIAIAPATNSLDIFGYLPPILALAAQGLVSIFPDLSLSNMLTPRGLAMVQLLEDAQACNIVMGEPFGADPLSPLTKPEFLNSTIASEFAMLTANGGKGLAGPLLVLQGTNDPTVLEIFTTPAIERTCETFPNSALTYVKAEQVGHEFAYATQQIWFKWLDERFKGSPAESGCVFGSIGVKSSRPLEDYQVDFSYFQEYSLPQYKVQLDGFSA